MKTPNEIAWNLLILYSENSPNPIVDLNYIAEATGLDLEQVENMFEKRKVLHSIFYAMRKLPTGLEGVKKIIHEIENKKPHYNLEEDHEYTRT